MAALKTFRFDLDFDDPKHNIDISEVDEKPADLEMDVQAIEPEPETYSEADIEIARQSGFESGKEVAAVEAQEKLDVKINEVLNLIFDQFSELEAKQLEFNRQLESQTISLINSVHKRIYPVTESFIEMNEVVGFSESILSNLSEQPQIVISVNDNLAEKFSEHINKFKENRSYSGEVIVKSSQEINAGECKLEWQGGGAKRDPETIISEIDQKFKDAIAALTETEEMDKRGFDATQVEDSDNAEDDNVGEEIIQNPGGKSEVIEPDVKYPEGSKDTES